MKLLFSIAVIGWSWISLLAAQPVFTGGVSLFDGIGGAQASKAYEFKGSYAIRWILRDVKPTASKDPLAAYWKPHTTQNPPWISIKVVDSITRKVVDSDFVTAWQNQMQIQTGGKHYLVVTATEHVAWSIYGKDGKLAGADGATVVALTAEDTGGSTAKAVAAMSAMLRDKFTGRVLEERLAAVKLVASRSKSAKDFEDRMTAYYAAQGW